MKCRDKIETIACYLDGDIAPRDAARLQKHMLECAECCAELERQQKILSILQNEPADSFYTDMRPECVKERRRRWFTVPVLSRKWAVAGGLALLMLFAGALGGYLKKPTTLYISNPRDYSPTVASSLAIAADFTQSRPAICPMLASDPRLKPLIDVKASGESLKKIAEELTRKTGVDISVSHELESQLLYLKLTNMPTSVALSEIAALTSSDWVSAPGKNGIGYKLVCSESVRKMAEAVADAQATAEAVDTLQQASTAIKLRRPSQVSNLGFQVRDLVDNTIKFRRTSDKHLAGYVSLGQFLLLDDEVVASLASGEAYERTYSQLLEKYRNAEWLQLYGKHERLDDNSIVRIYLSRTDEGSIMLSLDLIRESFSECGGGSEIWHPMSGSLGTNRVNSDDLDRIYREVADRNPTYRQTWLKAKLGNRACVEPYWKGKGVYTLLQMLNLIAERTNLQIAADYYTAHAFPGLILPREITIGEALALMDSEFGIVWSLSPNGVLRLVSRQWPLMRASEPPTELIRSINETIRRNGRPTMEETGYLGRLDRLQIRSAAVAIEDRELSGLLLNVVNNYRDSLCLYASLSPQQRIIAESPAGLSSSQMNEKLRHQARMAAHMLRWRNTGNYRTEEENNQFNFRIQNLHCSLRDLERMLGYTFLSGSGIFMTEGFTWVAISNPDPNAQRDYVVIEYSGAYKACGVFLWPE